MIKNSIKIYQLFTFKMFVDKCFYFKRCQNFVGFFSSSDIKIAVERLVYAMPYLPVLVEKKRKE